MPRRGVFKIINKQTGKVYIGSSNTNLDNLIYSYWQKLYSGEHHNTQLQSDFNRYGQSNFQVVIVNGSCNSENEVRSIREYEIYMNRHNTYNKDVPVHYGGGNPNGGFGGYSPNRNKIINDLLDIVDKSNLYPSYKSKIKSDIRNGKITNETQLNNEISYYTQLRKLLDILDQSDLSYSEKSSIRIDIKNGIIRNETH